MAGEFNVDKDRLGQIAQALLETKKMARSIENTAEAFMPLTDNEEVVVLLRNTMIAAVDIAKDMSELYQLIAKEALRA
jgi:hypothetical protein